MPGHGEQVDELRSQVKFLEEEVGLLRRRLTNAPRQVSILEEKLVETREQLAKAMGQNQKLADAHDRLCHNQLSFLGTRHSGQQLQISDQRLNLLSR
jgi:chromosome segregation ATPase